MLLKSCGDPPASVPIASIFGGLAQLHLERRLGLAFLRALMSIATPRIGAPGGAIAKASVPRACSQCHWPWLDETGNTLYEVGRARKTDRAPAA